MTEYVFVEFLLGTLGIAHSHPPANPSGDVVEMSRAQARLLGVQECPTCRAS